jgi:hypothetical protein
VEPKSRKCLFHFKKVEDSFGSTFLKVEKIRLKILAPPFLKVGKVEKMDLEKFILAQPFLKVDLKRLFFFHYII